MAVRAGRWVGSDAAGALSRIVRASGTSPALREVYVARGWARRAFTWHEAADVRVFRPHDAGEPAGDLNTRKIGRAHV